MTDVEVSGQRPATVPNPYANGDTSGVLPTWHPINVLWRVIWIGISLFGLQRFDAYHKVMHDPNVRHEWFKIGLATTVGAYFSVLQMLGFLPTTAFLTPKFSY